MKFRKRWGADGPTVGISDAVEAALDGRDHGTGQLEATAETADRTARAFGRLVEMLYENSKLTDANVLELVGYQYERIDG